MKTVLLKNWLLLLLIFGGASPLFAQTCGGNTSSGTACSTRSNFFHGEILPNNGCASFNSVSPYSPGEYFRMPVLAGGCYTISTCGATIDTQIGVYQGTATTGSFAHNDDNGPDCSGIDASVVITPTFTDYVRADVRQFNCSAGGTASITVKVKQNNNLNITSAATDMCQGQTRSLTATPARVTSGALTGSGDPGTFSGTGVFGTTFTAPVPAGATANISIIYAFGYCTQTQSITVYKNPSTANAGANIVTCDTVATLSASIPSIGNGTWTIISGPGTITNPTSPNSTVTGLMNGSATTCRWTVTHGPCTSNFDDMDVLVDPLPTPANAGFNQSVCDTFATISANTPFFGTGMWTLVGGSGTITNPSNPTTTVTNLGIGPNTFRWTISNATCTPSTDDVVVTRNAFPTTSIAGPDQVLCDSVTTLNGNAPSSGNGQWNVISGTATVVNPGTPTSAVTGIGVGVTLLEWNISSGACPASLDTMMITRLARPAFPTVTGNTDVCVGTTTTLTAASTAGSPVFDWWDQASGGTTLGTSATYTTPPIASLDTVWVNVVDSTGCSSGRIMVELNALALPIVSAGADTTACELDTICLSSTPGFVSYSWSNGDTQPNTCFTTGGNAIVTVTDTNGCQGMDSVMLNRLPLPIVNLGPDTAVCVGGSIVLGTTSSPGNSYSWNTGAVTSSITVSTAGTYSLICTDSNTCSGTDDVVISAASAPVAGFVVDSSMCPIISFTDNSTDGAQYDWSFGDGSTASGTATPTYDYTNAGNGIYTVTLVTTGPCGVDSVSQQVVINCLVALSDDIGQGEINIFPNPNNGSFRVEVNEIGTEPFTLFIYNAVGQQVYEWTQKDHNGTFGKDINLSHQPAGVFYAKMIIGDQKLSRRIIIQR